MMKRKYGFTLLEVLVVVMIISILATIVVVNVAGGTDEAKVAKAQADIRSISAALEMYKLDNDLYPTTEQGLKALLEPSTAKPMSRKFKEGGYLQSRKFPVDPWKRMYIYLAPGMTGKPYELISYGADGEPGGDRYSADISCWDM